ncbi:copper homeostasis periplasmic binding protein CopC [Sphingomonas sp.]|uniref:copper homeostasis periplasmic binding protein CopC n=1 Tax=Sphingomonas sp. TaxID=28214 RepID=UPI003752D9A1
MALRRIITGSAFAVALLAGGVAQAHPHLVGSSPRANSVVAATSRVSLTFSERLLAPMSGGDVIMTRHPGVPHHMPMKIDGFKASVAPDGKTLQLIAARPLATGSYQVKWHAVAADTHRVAGAFAFQVR